MLPPAWFLCAALAAPRAEGPAADPPTAAPDEARAIAREAFIYAFPMLENFRTLARQVGDPQAPEYVGGFGRFRHYSRPFTPDNHDVVTPNNDTPYSWAWLDLRAEPWVLEVPRVPGDRYYVVQMIDLYTFNFAYVGSRATGNDRGRYLIAGPGYSGDVPPGIDAVFRSETQLVCLLARTALAGPDDVPNVEAVQKGMTLLPLSAFLGRPAPRPAAPIELPAYDEERAAGPDFIGYLNFLLTFCQPPHPSETELVARLGKLGIGPGRPFNAAAVAAPMREAIAAGIADAKQDLVRRGKTTLSSNGLFGSRAFLKNDYLARAVAAEKGLYGNSVEEAWYGGYLGVGRKPKQIRFPPGGLPPARFFWSITLYTLPDRFLYANPLERYSIGDRTPGLAYDPDGGLTITVSHQPPPAELRGNWLPAPEGSYSLVVRLYGPGQEAVDGTWKLPRLEDSSALPPVE